MKVRRLRDNVFELRVTSQELSALVAAARMTRDAMLDDPRAPAEAAQLLDQVVRDYDRAVARSDANGADGGDGERPPS